MTESPRVEQKAEQGPPADTRTHPPPGGASRPAPLGRPQVASLLKATLLLCLFFVVSGLAALALQPLREVSFQAWMLGVIGIGGGAGVLAGLRLARWPLAKVLGSMGFSAGTLRWLPPLQLGNLLLIGSLVYGLTKIFGPVEHAFLDELFDVGSAGEFLLLFFTVAVAAPLVEELLFRGILLRALTLSWGARGGILWSAFFFALIHLNPLQAAPAFVNGFVWALVLLRTGSLGATFLLHALNNGLVFLIVQVARLAERTAGPGAASIATPPASVRAAAAAAVALVGLWLIRTALRALPKAPGRLERLWDLPAAPAPAGPLPAVAAPE